jgi:hypothetical protein
MSRLHRFAPAGAVSKVELRFYREIARLAAHRAGCGDSL